MMRIQGLKITLHAATQLPVKRIDVIKIALRIITLGLIVGLTGCQQDRTNDSAANTNAQNSVETPAPWLELKTRNSRYRLRIDDSYETVPAGQMHYWDIHVMTIDEQPLTPQRIKVSGTMPGHGHGMATFPKATPMDQPGLMRVKGMKFHMGGQWRMRVDINDAAGPDYAYFELNVQPALTEAPAGVTYTPEELAQLKALQLSALPPLKNDPSNRLSLNADAAALGEKLFFDPGLSQTGTVSCATCHSPEHGFGDGKVLSFGTATTKRHAPALLGVAHSTWFYWDGRRDTLWAQALSPLETSGEMDNTRVDVLKFVLNHSEYGPEFTRLTGFTPSLLENVDDGAGPYASDEGKAAWMRIRPPKRERLDAAFSFVGKILAAYEESLQHTPARFDEFVELLLKEGEKAASKVYSESEMRGARLYANEERTPCLRCHNGALLTNQEFHNIDTGLSADGEFDVGRELGLKAAKLDPFNCFGVHSDASREQCTGLNFGRGNHLDAGAFKTPGLRNLVNTAPYFHDGRKGTLEEVLAHYLASQGDSEDTHEMPEFALTGSEAADLIAFLKTL